MKITKYLLIGILIFCIPLFFYAINFKELVISDNPDDWGTFGDYFGGVLNPFLAMINIAIFIYLTQLVSNYEDKRTEKSLEYQKKITLNEFRQQECTELAKALNEVLQELPRYKIALEKAMIALYKIRTCNDKVIYLFPILKEEENVKLIDDLTDNLNKIIKTLDKIKSDLEDEELTRRLLKQFDFKDDFGPIMSEYLTLKTRFIQVLQKYIIDDLNK